MSRSRIIVFGAIAFVRLSPSAPLFWFLSDEGLQSFAFVRRLSRSVETERIALVEIHGFQTCSAINQAEECYLSETVFTTPDCLKKPSRVLFFQTCHVQQFSQFILSLSHFWSPMNDLPFFSRTNDFWIDRLRSTNISDPFDNFGHWVAFLIRISKQSEQASFESGNFHFFILPSWDSLINLCHNQSLSCVSLESPCAGTVGSTWNEGRKVTPVQCLSFDKQLFTQRFNWFVERIPTLSWVMSARFIFLPQWK